MGLFDRLFKSKNPESKKFRRDMAYAVSGQSIKYVTEKKNGVDEVVGRGGALNIRNDEFIVYSSADVVFRCPVDELQIWELMSKDGIVLTGKDLEHGGVERTIIAFYVYYRK